MRSSATFNRRCKLSVPFLLIAALALLFASCAARTTGDNDMSDRQAAPELKQIHTVAVTEDDQQTILRIS